MKVQTKVNEVNGTKNVVIEADKDMMNILSIIFNEAYESFKEKNWDGLANDSVVLSQSIFKALDGCGFYDGCKDE